MSIIFFEGLNSIVVLFTVPIFFWDRVQRWYMAFKVKTMETVITSIAAKNISLRCSSLSIITYLAPM